MKTKTALTVFVLLISFALVIQAQTRRRSNMSTNSSGQVSSCGDLRVTFDRRPAVTQESQLSVSPGQGQALKAQTTNSGIYVIGWDRAEYSVTTCKAVPDDDPNPSASLGEITTRVSGSQITVEGPSDSNRQWSAALIINVPRISSLDLHTTNGPLELRDLAGNIQVGATNGPIDLNNVGGSVQATTANGPISVVGSSGDQRLSANNGPIHIALSGGSWNGPGLEASTHNGPLSISIPENYSSAIRIQASEHSPMSCNSSVCGRAVRSLGSPSVISIGSGDPVVRLSTMNGPLSIQ
jgi:DUF4097 and DUF4098 domain-containing protein YvlB